MAKEKATHEEVRYENPARGKAHCSECQSYLGPNNCKGVVAPIAPGAWCERYFLKPLGPTNE